MEGPSNQNSLPVWKRRIYAGTILVLAVGLCLLLGEYYFAHREKAARDSQRLDAGMFKYDAQIGWKMTPNWKGRHHHVDYDVVYEINGFGYRGSFNGAFDQTPLKVAMVGDSFTFGFGVSKGQTFPALLNEEDHLRVFNFGVPGYSTDQEYLLILQHVLVFHPSHVWMVVYLGNDIIDNTRPFPLQTNQSKPYFELKDRKLVLRNVPVPKVLKPAALANQSLGEAVFGTEWKQMISPVRQLLGKSALFRRTGGHRVATLKDPSVLQPHFQKAAALFGEIAAQTARACRHHGVFLGLILMPGRSYIQSPRSLSARMQAAIHQQVLAKAGQHQIAVIDLATEIKQRAAQNAPKWFFPQDGHLTVFGHRQVAALLKGRLTDLQP